MFRKTLLFFLASVCLPLPALSGDVDECGKGMICASDPATIVQAMQEEGYQAKLEKDDLGDPMIQSQASGYDFQVYFYDCIDGKSCKAIQFYTGFRPESDQTPVYANLWNRDKRFIKAAVTDDKELNLKYDLSTVGGVNKLNFADAVDWWATMLGEFAKFVDEQSGKKKKG